MAGNIRRILSGKKDLELGNIHLASRNTVLDAAEAYREGGASIQVAMDAVGAAEISTVAAAIIKQRVETGCRGSHRDIQYLEGVNISHKRIDREKAEGLRERQRV